MSSPRPAAWRWPSATLPASATASWSSGAGATSSACPSISSRATGRSTPRWPTAWSSPSSKAGATRWPFSPAPARAIWEKQENLADEATLQRLAGEEGLDGSVLLAQARAEATAEAYRQNLQDAVAADVFGSPAYVLDGEVFWGQDRLGLLEEALVSGRPPFRPEVNGGDLT